MSLRQLFDQDYELWRFEEGIGDDGFPIQEWVKIADIAGTIRPAISISESFVSGAAWSDVKHVFYCPADTPVLYEDQIRKPDQTVVGDVVAVYRPSRPIYIACRLSELQR